MARTISGNDDLNRVMKNNVGYVHEITLPTDDFTGGTLTFDKDDVIVFGTDQKQAYSICQEVWNKVNGQFDDRVAIKHRLVDNCLIDGGNASMNIINTKASLMNVWIEGNKLKLEFKNTSGDKAELDKTVYYEVHK